MDNWMLRPWRRALDFRGRATRREYWLFALQLTLIFGAMLLFAGLAAGWEQSAGLSLGLSGMFLIFYLFAFIASLAVAVRRLHDHDKTGWLCLLPLLPIAGPILFLVMMLLPGTKGENRYGRDPRMGEKAGAAAVGEIFS